MNILEDKKISTTQDLSVVICGSCGGGYAISERYRQYREENGGGWHCPYCKVGWGYYNTSTVSELQKKLDEEIKRNELERKRTAWARQDAEHQRRVAIAERGAKTRLKNRISNGVCPCCNRSFKNLQAHMIKQHPNFSEGKKSHGKDTAG